MSEPFDLRKDAPALAGMGALFLISIALAMAFSFTFLDQNIRAFEDPDSLANPLIYLAIVVVFTIIILAIVKYGKRVIIKYIVLGSVLLTIYYVVAPLLGTVLTGFGSPPFGIGVAGVIGLAAAIALSALLWFYPEWYVIDTVGVVVAAGAAGIFGISFDILPSLLLLVAFAVYDAIAVYRTKHMLDLADSVLELRLPIMFVVPKTRGYSFLEETRRVGQDAPEEAKKEPREAMFMGLGDAVIPGILVVSALTFLDPNVPAVLGMPAPLFVAIVALIGSFVGFSLLMYFVMKGRPHAGLPLLNGGAITGFLLALLPLYGFAPLWPF
ncbi:MAG TPA: presenilin family intramembrane aspartyl protease PSH [Candidatus Thermoplasmatota archaeon]|nr:presenilin family intramembrane aspartyl protease PSH [Candidatus Thermoplasmatota archaeon]